MVLRSPRRSDNTSPDHCIWSMEKTSVGDDVDSQSRYADQRGRGSSSNHKMESVIYVDSQPFPGAGSACSPRYWLRAPAIFSTAFPKNRPECLLVASPGVRAQLPWAFAVVTSRLPWQWQSATHHSKSGKLIHVGLRAQTSCQCGICERPKYVYITHRASGIQIYLEIRTQVVLRWWLVNTSHDV